MFTDQPRPLQYENPIQETKPAMNSRRNFMRGIAAGVTAGFCPAAHPGKKFR